MPRTRRDRGAVLTWTLLVLGLALLGAVVGVLAFREPPGHRAVVPSAPATTAAPPATSAPAPAPAPPIAAVALTPFSATIEWRTPEATRGRVSAALAGGPPTLWSEPVGPARVHRTTIAGLALDSDYRFEAGGRTLDVHTPRATGTLVASTGGGNVLVNGQPFFPLMVWGECPTVYGDLLNAGVNLLAQNPCSGADAQVVALEGRALSAGIAGDADAQNPSLIGWFYPDEADLRRLTARTLPAVPPASEVGRISFLTLSNHFYSQAAPLVWGRSMYHGLAAKADVVGFDLYPLQNWCQVDGFQHVYAAQAELEALAPGKPTFQWIEASTMECGDRPGLGITPETVRLESWLAIAAGAHGLGFFPGSWTGAVATAVTGISRDVKAIAPALLGPRVGVTASGVRAAAWSLNGALYVVATNPTRSAVRGSVTVSGAGGRAFGVLDEGRSVRARHDVLAERFPPLGARVYVAAPAD